MLVLIIGDLHIPYRRRELCRAFRERLQPAQLHHILCTGNLCVRSALDALRALCPEISAVRGEFDDDGVGGAEQAVLTVGGLRIALVSSYRVFPAGDLARLAIKRRELGADVVVHGGTHAARARIHDGGLYLDPGSATGAFTPADPAPAPSFILLDVQGTDAVASIVTLGEDGAIAETRESFAKSDE
jgi:putative phosphoesterase